VIPAGGNDEAAAASEGLQRRLQECAAHAASEEAQARGTSDTASDEPPANAKPRRSKTPTALHIISNALPLVKTDFNP